NPITPRQKDTCDFIRKHPGATYMDLVGKFGKTRQAIIYHMNKLIKIGLVRGERVKNKFHFYLEK
ncbi:MAG: winged helix-turn-helix transcriptional regulator, partial [Candidatus Thermoplasmatota archaeon]|nr:winged helix-turn-helix transcriptional regulator [Candidatus Thermoplasmatota archaeon]